MREALRRLLWPLPPGGVDGNGWPLGRAVRERELEVEVSRVAGVAEVTGLNLFAPGPTPGGRCRPAPPTAPKRWSWQRGSCPSCWRWRSPRSDGAPADLSPTPNPFADADAVAVPVVPELC